jgi:hypothetical protein
MGSVAFDLKYGFFHQAKEYKEFASRLISEFSQYKEDNSHENLLNNS